MKEERRKTAVGRNSKVFMFVKVGGDFMGEILDFPVEYWSERDREKLREMQNDILLAKAHGDYKEDFELSDDEWAKKLKKNIKRDIKEGKLFSWLEEFKED